MKITSQSLSKTYFIFAAILVALASLTAFGFSKEMVEGPLRGEYFYFISITGVLLFISSIHIALSRDFLFSNILVSLKLADKLLIIWCIYVLLRSDLTTEPHLLSTKVTCLILCMGLYFTVRFLFESRYKGIIQDIIVYGLIIGGLIQSILGLLQFYGILQSFNSFFKITGTFINPAPFSFYLSAVIPFPLTYYLFRKKENANKRFNKFFLLFTSLIIIVVLGITKIRSSWLAASIVIILILAYKHNLLFVWKSISSKKRILFGILIALIVFSGGIGLYKFKIDSSHGRLFIWKLSLNKFIENPISGIGYGKFEVAYNNWQAEYFMKNKEYSNEAYLADYIEVAYNEYIEIATETGLIGLVLFLSVIMIGLRQAIKSLKKNFSAYVLSSLGGVLALLICALFSYPFSSLPTWILFFILFAALVSSKDLDDDVIIHHPDQKKIKHTHFINLGISAILLVFTIFITNPIFKISSYKEWERGNIAYKDGDFITATDSYEKAYKDLRDNGLFLIDYARCLSERQQHSMVIDILEEAKQFSGDAIIYMGLGVSYQKLKQYDKAEQAYYMAYYMLPNRMYPKYMLVKMFVEKGNINKAISIAQEITKLKIKINSAASNQILNEMRDLINKYSGVSKNIKPT